MSAADLRAILAGLVVIGVGLFGEVGWPWPYLFGGLLLTVVAMGITVDSRTRIQLFEVVLWAAFGWSVVAAFVISGSAEVSKATLASWGGALVIWVAVAQSRGRGRRVVSNALLGGALLLGGAVVAGVGGAPELMANRNISVAMIVSAAPLVFNRFRPAWKNLLVVTLMLIPVVITGSRAGVLAVLVVVISLWTAARTRRWAVAVGAAGGMGVIAWRLISRPDSLAWYRWRIWGAILESIGDRPFWGIGAGSVADAMGLYRLEHLNEVGHWGHIIGGAESMPLGLAVRVGLPGLILACGAMVLWFLRSRHPTRVTTAILGAIIAMGLFHDFWSEPAVLWWWAAVLGVATLHPRARPKTFQSSDRWFLGLAVGGIFAWALVQPVWAQCVWLRQAPGPESVTRAVRAEPWFSAPMRRRVESLLSERYWTWTQASEALVWSRRQVEIRRGSAESWGLLAQVNARIILEFGAWPATVENARRAYVRASALEPRLPWYPYNQALMERGLGNLEGAKSLAMRSVDLEPAFVRGWFLVARLDLDGGHFDAARAALDRGVASRNEGEPRAWTTYHRDVILCPTSQLKSLDEEIR